MSGVSGLWTLGVPSIVEDFFINGTGFGICNNCELLILCFDFVPFFSPLLDLAGFTGSGVMALTAAATSISSLTSKFSSDIVWVGILSSEPRILFLEPWLFFLDEPASIVVDWSVALIYTSSVVATICSVSGEGLAALDLLARVILTFSMVDARVWIQSQIKQIQPDQQFCIVQNRVWGHIWEFVR